MPVPSKSVLARLSRQFPGQAIVPVEVIEQVRATLDAVRVALEAEVVRGAWLRRLEAVRAALSALDGAMGRRG